MDMPAVAPDSPSEVAPPIRSQCALCPQVSNRDAWLTSNALVQLQDTTTIAAKPHPKSACLLQRSLDVNGAEKWSFISKTATIPFAP